MFGFKKDIKEYDLTQEELEKFKYAKLTTENGVIFLKLFYKSTPQSVANFATLANDGFYDGLKFHRVISGFVAQGGCPKGNGTGGPQWAIKCETNSPKQIHKKGSLSMAHAGKNTGGSQFFICFEELPHLDGAHTVFGEIEDEDTQSFITLEQIQQDDKIVSIEILNSKE